jgi:hypothetical protein
MFVQLHIPYYIKLWYVTYDQQAEPLFRAREYEVKSTIEGW